MLEREREHDREDARIFANLEQLSQEPGFIYTFCLMVASFLWMSANDVAEIDWTERPNQEELSLLLGLLVKRPIRLDVIPSDEDVLGQGQRAIDLLRELHLSLSSPTLPSNGSRADDPDRLTGLVQKYDEWMGSGKGMVEPIFYGGQGAYDFQFLEMASKRYTADEPWIQQHKGDSLQAFVETVKSLQQLALKRIRTIKLGKTPKEACRAVLHAMTFGPDDLPQTGRDSLYHLTRAFSFTPGDINQEFNGIGDYNAVHSRPVMALEGGQYCIPIFANLPKAIYDNPYYWMVDDEEYRDTALKNRGDATESITYDLLASVFGSQWVFKGVAVTKGKADVTDIDVLAVSGNKAVIAQCKSKKLTVDARSGSGNALRGDFTKAVQDAYDQAVAARKAILDGTCRITDAEGDTISLPHELDEVYILCLTGDHYPAVLPQARAYLKKQDTDPHPIILSIFDLDLVSHYLKDKYEFLYYLRQRSTYAQHFMADSELSLIGYHLKHKLFPDENYHMTAVDRGYGQLVDANFLASRGHWPHTEASKRLFHTWQNGTFTELSEDIKLAARKEPSQITPEDLLFFLYDLAGKGADDLISCVEELKRWTLSDGQEHSARLLAGGSKGVTFVSFPTPTHPAQLQSVQMKLQAIGFAHKYKSQADEWMILASFAGSPVRFDLFGYIRGPWRQDPEIDRLVEANLASGIPVRPDGKRPGRNDICPCGSGRKFKRCHGV